MKGFHLGVAVALLFGVAGCAGLKTAVREPWWAWPPGTGVTTCGTPAVYRVDGGQPRTLGSCAGALVTDPAVVDLRIGQELDLHMTSDATAAGSGAPVYPLPADPDISVLRLVGVSDGSSTGRYRAKGAGAVILTTTGWCIDDRTSAETQGACPILRVHVTP